jgi:hypothetical protein
MPGWPGPFAPPALPGLCATTGRSAPVLRIGYSTPRSFTCSKRSPSRPDPFPSRGIEATGSQVPHGRPNCARAAFMPDTTWPISRPPPGSSRSNDPTPVLMSSIRLRHFIGRFAFARLRSPYLTRSAAAPFPPAQHHGSLPQHPTVVCRLPLQSGGGGSVPPSPVQHRNQKIHATYVIAVSLRALGARSSA